MLSTAVPRSDPDHLLVGDFSKYWFRFLAILLQYLARKPAIGLLTHQWPDRARGFRMDSEILLATSNSQLD